MSVYLNFEKQEIILRFKNIIYTIEMKIFKILSDFIFTWAHFLYPACVFALTVLCKDDHHQGHCRQDIGNRWCCQNRPFTRHRMFVHSHQSIHLYTTSFLFMGRIVNVICRYRRTGVIIREHLSYLRSISNVWWWIIWLF